MSTDGLKPHNPHFEFKVVWILKLSTSSYWTIKNRAAASNTLAWQDASLENYIEWTRHKKTSDEDVGITGETTRQRFHLLNARGVKKLPPFKPTIVTCA